MYAEYIKMLGWIDSVKHSKMKILIQKCRSYNFQIINN